MHNSLRLIVSNEDEQEPVDDVDLDLKVARFENLMDRRPILLSSVLLRQNPHNVNEWLKRALLFSSNPLKVLFSTAFARPF
jgi:hypothetical protein